jgi:hypothetical protein
MGQLEKPKDVVAEVPDVFELEMDKIWQLGQDAL